MDKMEMEKEFNTRLIFTVNEIIMDMEEYFEEKEQTKLIRGLLSDCGSNPSRVGSMKSYLGSDRVFASVMVTMRKQFGNKGLVLFKQSLIKRGMVDAVNAIESSICAPMFV